MAKTRHLLLLVTTLVAYIGSTNGGYYPEQSNTENIQNQNNEPLNIKLENVAPSNENQQSEIIQTNQSLDEKQNNEDDVSTRYELDQTVPQNVNEEQYARILNQLKNNEHKLENFFFNEQQSLPNTGESASTPSPIAQPPNPESVNIQPDQYDTVESVNTNKVVVTTKTVKTTNLQSFYPALYPSYANIGAIPAQPTVHQLPLSPSEPQGSGHPIQIDSHVANLLPHAHVELPVQSHNLLPLPLSSSQTLVSGPAPVVANVQNVLPQANLAVLPPHPVSVHPLPLSSVQSVVEGHHYPLHYNAYSSLPYANYGYNIPARSNVAVPLPLRTAQVVVGTQIPVKSGVVNVLPQDNRILSQQPNTLLPLPISQQAVVSGYQTPVAFNVQNVPSPVNVAAGGQFLLNSPSGYSNVQTQNILPANIQQAPVAPIVTKDIYFHAAPPDFDDAPAPILPPKKSYKIIFIKLPSQERKNTALLQSLVNQYAVREDKTLIYVLVKKPEEQQVIVPQSKAPSEHEVLFVKYKDVKENSATEATNEAESKHDDSLLLKPGLVNGH